MSAASARVARPAATRPTPPKTCWRNFRRFREARTSRVDFFIGFLSSDLFAARRFQPGCERMNNAERDDISDAGANKRHGVIVPRSNDVADENLKQRRAKISPRAAETCDGCDRLPR